MRGLPPPHQEHRRPPQGRDGAGGFLTWRPLRAGPGFAELGCCEPGPTVTGRGHFPCCLHKPRDNLPTGTQPDTIQAGVPSAPCPCVDLGQGFLSGKRGGESKQGLGEAAGCQAAMWTLGGGRERGGGLQGLGPWLAPRRWLPRALAPRQPGRKGAT